VGYLDFYSDWEFANASDKIRCKVLMSTMTNPAQGSAAEVRAECSDAQKLIFDILYLLIRKHAGQCIEIAWPKQRIVSFGVGPKKMSQHHCYIAVYGAHINLGFYHGALLTDRNGILEGTGKGLRHVKITSPAMANNPALVELIQAAVSDRQKHRQAS
jgi:Domain of unknown function (DU1801)